MVEGFLPSALLFFPQIHVDITPKETSISCSSQWLEMGNVSDRVMSQLDLILPYIIVVLDLLVEIPCCAHSALHSELGK